MRKYICIFRFTALLLIAACLLPAPAMAAAADPVAPCASLYLDSYSAYVCPMGGGELQIWFDAMGTGIEDELGCLRIVVHESTDGVNYTWKKTYVHQEYPNMLSYNDNYHSSYVTYQGVAGRFYKAYVCIWGGSDGDGDTRYFFTSAKRAT